MTRKLSIVSVLILSGAAFGDILVSNFENGWEQYGFGSDWFYFSDRSNGGNSKIINAIEKTDGSYEAFKPDTPGYVSNNCAVVKFKMGDSFPVDNDGNVYHNFAGIGTDVLTLGRIADFTGATAVHFMAKGTEGFTICCDLVTSDILDNAFFRAYITLSENWTHYVLQFNEFSRPEHYAMWRDTGKVDMSKLEKISWKMFSDIYGKFAYEGSDSKPLQDSGYFSIDEIYLIGINWEPTNILPVTSPTAHQPCSIYNQSVMDCLGRHIMPSHRFQSSGMYIWTTGKTFQKRIISR